MATLDRLQVTLAWAIFALSLAAAGASIAADVRGDARLGGDLLSFGPPSPPLTEQRKLGEWLACGPR